MNTKIDVEGLRAKAEGATKGEWAYECQPFGCPVHVGGSTFATVFAGAAITGKEWPYVENAAYIVAAQPQTILAMLDYIEELEARVGAVR